MTNNIIKYVLAEAAKSNVEKRKVGCVIVDKDGKIAGVGRNAIVDDGESPDIHAEEMAIADFLEGNNQDNGPYKAFVTHPPCPNCALQLNEHGINEVEVVSEFMKFDSSKPRYELIPPLLAKAVAMVLTYGAMKYKPNNWRNCPDLDRFLGAAYRHLQAYREGEIHDLESGMPHLWHVISNLTFIMELDEKSNKTMIEIGPISSDIKDKI